MADALLEGDQWQFQWQLTNLSVLINLYINLYQIYLKMDDQWLCKKYGKMAGIEKFNGIPTTDEIYNIGNCLK